MSQELLEKAAKAAGLIVKKNTEVVDADDQFIGIRVRDTERDKYRLWNPLTDDGDAFRLAVKLGMDVDIDAPRWKGGATWAMSEEDPDAGVSVAHNGDPYAATRLAIVRAAAAMGAKP